MRKTVARTLAVVAVAATGFLLPATAEAATPGITVDVATPQQVGLDPSAVAVKVGWSVAGCPNGCDLFRVSTLRANYDQVRIDSRTFGNGALRSFTVNDRITGSPSLGYSFSYELRRWTSAAHTQYNVVYTADATPGFQSEDAFRYDAGWRRELQLASTETMIMRTAAAGATATLPASSEPRKVGIISAKGPKNGVMRVAVNGAVQTTVDLAAATWTPRQVVAAATVPAGAVLTVVDATPTGRSNSDVHVDGLVTLPVAGSSAAASSRRFSTLKAATPKESVDATVHAPQQLPTAGTGPAIDVVAHVLGCPSGCAIIRQVDGVETVLVSRTSPASATLQTLSATDHEPFDGSVTYYLRKGSSVVAMTDELSPTAIADTALTYSYGWTRDANGGSTDGRIMRSSTPGTGATFRVPGTFAGRNVGIVSARGPQNGVMGVYVNGALVQKINLNAPSWQPRQVVASVTLPLTGRVTVSNATPATSATKDVHVDGLVLLDEPNDWY